MAIRCLSVPSRLGTARFRHGSEIGAVAFAPDGKTVASVAKESGVHLWDAVTGKELRSFPGHAVAFSPDCKTLATTGWSEKTAWVWDLQSGKQLQSFRGHQDRVVWSPLRRWEDHCYGELG